MNMNIHFPTHFYACQTIRDSAGTFKMVQQSMIKSVHVHACTDSGGGHFECFL